MNRDSCGCISFTLSVVLSRGVVKWVNLSFSFVFILSSQLISFSGNCSIKIFLHISSWISKWIYLMFPFANELLNFFLLVLLALCIASILFTSAFLRIYWVKNRGNLIMTWLSSFSCVNLYLFVYLLINLFTLSASRGIWTTPRHLWLDFITTALRSVSVPMISPVRTNQREFCLFFLSIEIVSEIEVMWVKTALCMNSYWKQSMLWTNSLAFKMNKKP